MGVNENTHSEKETRNIVDELFGIASNLDMPLDDISEKIFVAYSRKLLRTLDKIEKALDEDDLGTAKELVKELKEDTEKDIVHKVGFYKEETG